MFQSPMTHKLPIKPQGPKHYKSEFIFKLIDIMKNYPELVSWTHDGNGVQFSQVTQIQNSVLTSYFRHSNFQSFLRQLHLYNFRQKKSNKNQLIFEHAIFRKGNQEQFFLIQRTKHKKQKQSLMKELENNDILKQIAENQTLDSNLKNILSSLLSFKLIVLQKQKILKQKLNQLTASLNSNRSKNTKSNLSVLEEEIKLEMDSNKKFSKSIDIYLTETLNQRSRDQTEKSDKIIELQRKQQQKQQNDENLYKKSQIKPISQYEKSPVFPCIKPFQNNSQAFCPQSSFYAYHNFFNKHPNDPQANNPLAQKDNRQKKQYRQVMSNQFDQKRLFPSEVSQSQDFMGCRNNTSIPMGFFNFQREPSLIFMPLPVYNRSVMSEFFDRPNNITHTDFGVNDKSYESKYRLIPPHKSKSQEFQTSGQNTKINGHNEENIMNAKQDSEISFMNEECPN